MKKPFIIKLLSIVYIMGGILLIILMPIIAYLHFINSNLICTIILQIFPSGGFGAGDTFINKDQIYFTIIIMIIPLFINGILSTLGGIYSLKTENQLGWYLMIGSSIIYTLILIGLITIYIYLKENIKSIYFNKS